MRNPDHVFSPDNLISHVWTADEEVGPDTLRTHIMNIRKKIDKSNLESFIETVHGIGYRLKKVSHEQ
jgi:DNA-binding response OmpR family regulator